jgi:hypothetical protein
MKHYGSPKTIKEATLLALIYADLKNKKTKLDDEQVQKVSQAFVDFFTQAIIPFYGDPNAPKSQRVAFKRFLNKLIK